MELEVNRAPWGEVERTLIGSSSVLPPAGGQGQSEDQRHEQPARIGIVVGGLADRATASALGVDVAVIIATTSTTFAARRRGGRSASTSGRTTRGGGVTRSTGATAGSGTTLAAATTATAGSTLTAFAVGEVQSAVVVAGDRTSVEALREAGLTVHLVTIALFASIDVAVAAGEEVRTRDDATAHDVNIHGVALGEFPGVTV